MKTTKKNFDFKKKDGRTSLCSELPVAIANPVQLSLVLSKHLVVPLKHPSSWLPLWQSWSPIQLSLFSRLLALQLFRLPIDVEDSAFPSLSQDFFLLKFQEGSLKDKFHNCKGLHERWWLFLSTGNDRTACLRSGHVLLWISTPL